MALPGPEDRIIGALVRRRRLSVGLSMAELGREIGCIHQQVQKYETGANRIAVTTLIRIARALGVTSADLMDEIEMELADAARARSREPA